MVLFACAFVFNGNIIKIMNKLIIDAAKNNIFFVIMSDNNVYSITHENSKINCERLIILVTKFLNSHNLKINDINLIYINRGPGSFAGIRNSSSMIKAIHMIKKLIIIPLVLRILRAKEI